MNKSNSRLLQIAGLFALLEQELTAPENTELLKEVFACHGADDVKQFIVERRLDIGAALIDGACPNAAYCMDGAVCYLANQCASRSDSAIINKAHDAYLKDRENPKHGRA